MQIPSTPAIINVNVLRGACPCSCVHCPVGLTPQGKRAERFGQSEMELDLFEQILEQTKGFGDPPTIRVHAVGEPLLWKHLPAALKKCREAGLTSWLFTSASIDLPGVYRSVSEFADVIEVSVNSCTHDDYNKTKGIDAFEQVYANIGYMKGLSPRRLIVSRVQTDDAEADKSFVRYWKDSGLADDAFVRSYHDYNRILNGVSPAVMTKPCLVHFARLNIDTDGTVVVCFNELFKQERLPVTVLGNISQTSIPDIWHGEKLHAIREASLSGDYTALPGLCCCDCAYCQPLDTTRQTSEYQLTQIGGQNDTTIQGDTSVRWIYGV